MFNSTIEPIVKQQQYINGKIIGTEQAHLLTVQAKGTTDFTIDEHFFRE
jgi:hypothetical protein